MKAIANYVHRSEPTVLLLIRNYDLPAKKVGGIWESDTEAIDKWRMEHFESAKKDRIKKAGKNQKRKKAPTKNPSK
jgi:hypothetical protein